LTTKHNLAVVYWHVKQFDRSIPLYEETLRLRKIKIGADHHETLRTQVCLGINYRDVGRVSDAIALLEEAYERGRKQPALTGVGPELAKAYEKAGQLAKAEQVYRESVEDARKQFGPDDPRTAATMTWLGLNLLLQERYAEAEPLLRQGLA